jgi:hypothetical protein
MEDNMLTVCTIEVFSKVSLVELFARGVFEGFLLVLANYAFARKRIIWKPYIITSVLVALITYFIKLLPITFGVPMILSALAMIFLCVFISKIDLFTSVKGAMLTILILIVIETLNFLFLSLILNESRYNEVVANPYQMLVAGMPGLALFAAVVISTYLYLSKRPKKGRADGTTGK